MWGDTLAAASAHPAKERGTSPDRLSAGYGQHGLLLHPLPALQALPPHPLCEQPTLLPHPDEVQKLTPQV